MNCKPGDLAYLSSDCVDEGRIVEVIHAVDAIDGLPAWRCRARDPLHVTYQRSGKEGMSSDICVPDRYLRPINGVPVHDEHRDEVKA